MKTFAMLAVALLSLSGCAFGTNRVTLPAMVMIPLPASGDQLTVQVRDGRADLSGSQVGFKRNGYGAKTGTVVLADNEALTDRLTRDLVVLLRERGVRAHDSTTLPAGRANVIVAVEITSFLVDSKMGVFRGSLQSFAVLRVRMVSVPMKQTVWEEIIRAEAVKKRLTFVTEEDHQKVVEQLYRTLLDKLRDELAPALILIATSPPPRLTPAWDTGL